MNILSWALKIFSLIPYIANGVHVVEDDLTAGGLSSKLSAAQDSLALATAGATALLPASDQAKAGSIAQIAADSLAAAVTDLHNQAQPAK